MPYDNACKFLADQYPAAFASWILGEEVPVAKTLKTELKLEPIRADSVSLLHTGKLLLHLEFQVDVEEEPPMGLRMVDYWVQLYRKYRLPVRQCVILLRESAATRRFVGRFQHDRMLFTFDVIRLWELGKEVFLHDEELYPLAVLAATDQPEQLLMEVSSKIDTIKVVPKRRSIATTAYVLAGLRFSEEQLDLFFKEEIMKESVTYQKILKKGQIEGEARGEARGKANDVLKILAIRGFQVPKAIEQRVLACQDLELLDGWLTRAVTTSALDDVFS